MVGRDRLGQLQRGFRHPRGPPCQPFSRSDMRPHFPLGASPLQRIPGVSAASRGMNSQVGAIPNELFQLQRCQGTSLSTNAISVINTAPSFSCFEPCWIVKTTSHSAPEFILISWPRLCHCRLGLSALNPTAKPLRTCASTVEVFSLTTTN